ncbi:hypothetical protein UPYG_G00024260 [Umbra pygmaea]|uniref:Uncharacterized protein n=1 Tax=Umbra pygmaea TaxID=75934 RepID=A0ABD0XLG7_UMBPY
MASKTERKEGKRRQRTPKSTTQIQQLLYTHVLLLLRPPFSSQPNKMQSQLYCLHLVLLLMTQSSQCQKQERDREFHQERVWKLREW